MTESELTEGRRHQERVNRARGVYGLTAAMKLAIEKENHDHI